MDLNGNGITVSNDVERDEKNIPHKDGKPVHPIKADSLKPVIESYKEKGKPFKMRSFQYQRTTMSALLVSGYSINHLLCSYG